MRNELAICFLNMIDEFDDKNYILSIIIYHTAPVITKCKPSYLLIFHNKGKRNLYEMWEKNKQFIEKETNLKFFELKNEKDSIAVLFYYEDKLIEVLNQDTNMAFLKKFGYAQKFSLMESLEKLKERYKDICPHEIGVFLGYPIEDVIDFVEHPNKKALAFGYWKVYHNEQKAKNVFRLYDSVKEKLMKLIIDGAEPLDIINNV